MNPMYGILNSILRGLGLISTNLSWLGSNSFAFPSVVFVCIWKGFPLVMTMILAGLQSISKDYYEAAELDLRPRHRLTIPILNGCRIRFR